MSAAPSGSHPVHAGHNGLHAGSSVPQRDLKGPQIQFSERLLSRHYHDSGVVGLLIRQDHSSKNRYDALSADSPAYCGRHASRKVTVLRETAVVSAPHGCPVQIKGRHLPESKARMERIFSNLFAHLQDKFRIPGRRKDRSRRITELLFRDQRLGRDTGNHLIDNASSLSDQRVGLPPGQLIQQGSPAVIVKGCLPKRCEACVLLSVGLVVDGRLRFAVFLAADLQQFLERRGRRIGAAVPCHRPGTAP